ncbi:MAG: DNA translocase FtsK 4TM domain-containing protein [Myxococcota bacterium]|nr:DNA translocase FtsK 4TM domain-containing protein [Myxococcota bacterium]
MTGAATLLAGLSLWSYDARASENLVGPFGVGLASLLATALGLLAWAVPVELGLATARLFRGRPAILGPATAVSTLVIVLVGCALLQLALGGDPEALDPAARTGSLVFGAHLPGGVLGEVLGEVTRAILGTAGAYVVTITVLLVMLVLRTHLSIAAAIARASAAAKESATRTRDGATALASAWREARELERAERAAREEREAPRIVDGTLDEGLDDDDALDEDDELVDERTHALAEDDDATDEEPLDDDADDDDAVLDDDAEDDVLDASEDSLDDVTDDDAEEAEDSESDDEDTGPEPAAAAPAKKSAADPADSGKKSRAKKDDGPRIIAPVERVEPPVAAAVNPAPKKSEPPSKRKGYELPSIDLLERNEGERIKIDPALLRDNAKRLVEKLESYGVKGRVDEIHPGPVVTMYELEPKAGTKISKIAALENDLALALAAQKVRIVAPIPGKARVGIELPNDDRQTVYLREILEDPRWEQQKGPLPMALGKDIAGQPVYSDLSKMPHLLVAGATGAGKSVGINVMLASLLYKRSPEDVKMLMIDPKVVELAVFDGIPHMLLPVVTDMQKAALALRWAVDEMERRYQCFADAGARNIETYNRRVEKVFAGELAPEKLFPSKANKIRGLDHEGEEVWSEATEGESLDASRDALMEQVKKLPYIVVVVDEFADLMMVSAKDVEACIARLAQKARAAGIHVILATQRPSVDVITGMIKANFPARMAFKVSQREDSKTILGRIGAQNLLGRGDMLLLPPGTSDLKRVHCAYVSEEEVAAICDHVRAQGKPVYDESILQPRDEGEVPGVGGNSDDPLYDKAVAVVAQAGYCSISHLQRQLGVGYNKAAKLVEQMEAEGVVGPATKKAGGRRDVLIAPI